MDLIYIYIYSNVIIQIFGAAVYVHIVGTVPTIPTMRIYTSCHLIAELPV